jgi:hypothetical protein
VWGGASVCNSHFQTLAIVVGALHQEVKNGNEIQVKCQE